VKSLHEPYIYELLSEWLAYIQHRYSKHTSGRYKQVIQRFRRAAPAQYKNLTPQRIEEYLQNLPLATNSKNATLTVIKSFCRWCEDTHDLPNPTKKVKYLKAAPVKQRILSPEELQKVLAVCNDNNSGFAAMLPVVLFLSNTGLRISEFYTVSQDKISPDGRLLHIIGKGNKNRTVPLNQTARSQLPDVMNFLRYFPNQRVVYKYCVKLAHKADIPKFSPHSLRHYYATELAKTVPLCILSKLLGHKNALITQTVYVHLQDNDLVGTTDVLDGGKL